MPGDLRVGVVTHPQPDLSSPYFSACLAGLTPLFGESALVINPSDLSVDGWILLAPDAAQVERVRRTGKPAVILNGSAEGIPSIDLDNVGAAREITIHLADQGHRRIGFIAGKSETSNGRDRQEGYRRALAERGIPWDPDLVIEGRFSRDGGRAAMSRYLALRSPPTAIFAANDHMALGAWDVLTENNKKVPRDAALAGFDDIPEAEIAGLTSVRQPLTEMAQQAAAWLLPWIREGRPAAPRCLLFPGKRVERLSSLRSTE